MEKTELDVRGTGNGHAGAAVGGGGPLKPPFGRPSSGSLEGSRVRWGVDDGDGGVVVWRALSFSTCPPCQGRVSDRGGSHLFHQR